MKIEFGGESILLEFLGNQSIRVEVKTSRGRVVVKTGDNRRSIALIVSSKTNFGKVFWKD